MAASSTTTTRTSHTIKPVPIFAEQNGKKREPQSLLEYRRHVRVTWLAGLCSLTVLCSILRDSFTEAVRWGCFAGSSSLSLLLLLLVLLSLCTHSLQKQLFVLLSSEIVVFVVGSCLPSKAATTDRLLHSYHFPRRLPWSPLQWLLFGFYSLFCCVLLLLLLDFDSLRLWWFLRRRLTWWIAD